LEVFESAITLKRNIQDEHINRTGIKFTQVSDFLAIHCGQHLKPLLSEWEGRVCQKVLDLYR
jgi:hypothetical protein